MHEESSSAYADLMERSISSLYGVSLAAETVDSPSLKEDSVGFPSCRDAMRPEGGSHSEGITSSSVRGIEIEMCMMLGDRFCCLNFDCDLLEFDLIVFLVFVVGRGLLIVPCRSGGVSGYPRA